MTYKIHMFAMTVKIPTLQSKYKHCLFNPHPIYLPDSLRSTHHYYYNYHLSHTINNLFKIYLS